MSRRNGMPVRSLLCIGSDAKTVKGQMRGFLTGILYLAPATLAGIGNVCPGSTAGCRAACLYTAGRGRQSQIQESRINKTRWFGEDRNGFMQRLDADISNLAAKADREGLHACVRLNGTSDLPWENISFTDKQGIKWPNLMAKWPSIPFYDYTKIATRAVSQRDRSWPRNYRLTYSISEKAADEDRIETMTAHGVNVAIVFAAPRSGDLPQDYKSIAVHDGDQDDLRFLDPEGVIVGLRAKGDAVGDTSGFVRNLIL